jgi:hypothetical protein
MVNRLLKPGVCEGWGVYRRACWPEVYAAATLSPGRVIGDPRSPCYVCAAMAEATTIRDLVRVLAIRHQREIGCLP